MEQKGYKAVLKDGSPIITVIAKNPKHARVKVRDQLNRNASRRQYYDQWVRDGELVEEYDFS